jgi:hypothetical protein
MTDNTWFTICREAVLSLGLDPSCVEVLEAFPDRSDGDGLGAAPDLEGLELRVRMGRAQLIRRIADTLDGEVDRDQAELFGRRFQALMDLLDDLGGRAGEARVLRVGAAYRMAEILAAPTPRALRVRALVDFYTSHASLIHHQARMCDAPPCLEALVDQLHWTEAVPGLDHALIRDHSELGPVNINLLRATRPRIQALDCRRLARRAGRGFVQQVVHADAMAAISGGFFLYSEADIEPPSRRTDPVGMLLRDGELLNPPVFFRATIAQDEQGSIFIHRRGLVGTTVLWRDGEESTIASSNDLRLLDVQPAAFNRAWGESSPDHGGTSVAIVGNRVLALGKGSLPIPLAGFVLALPPSQPRRPAHAPGARVGYQLPPGPSGEPLHNAMAGGPMLLMDGRIQIDLRAEDFVGTAPPATFSGDETFDANLLPRMAVGLDEQDRLVIAAIDGRNFHRAPGFTLGAAARLMQALGCHTAMNLDGGSSKRMVLRGQVLDLPTTELIVDDPDEDPLDAAPVRPVHSALLLFYRTEKKGDEAEVTPDTEAEAEVGGEASEE